MCDNQRAQGVSPRGRVAQIESRSSIRARGEMVNCVPRMEGTENDGDTGFAEGNVFLPGRPR